MRISIYILIILLLGCNSCFLNKKVKQKEVDQVKTGKQNVSDSQHISIRSLASFKNDTIAYLRTNIYQQKKFFIGKKLEVLLDSLEIDVQNYFINDNPNKPDLFEDILILHSSAKDLLKNHGKEKLIQIFWSKPVDADSTYSLIKKTKGVWTNEAYAFYKDRIIKDIKMTNNE